MEHTKTHRLKAAYHEWRLHEPEDRKASCCSGEHFMNNAAIDDELVCQRERAWRDYVRIRDANPFFCRRMN